MNRARLYAEREASGLCLDCGLPAQVGNPRCQTCADKLKRPFVPKPATIRRALAELRRTDNSKDYTATYFITAGDDEPIKIGKTTAGLLQNRLAQLQTSHYRPLRIAAACYGGDATESLLHQAFRDARLVGEWFRRSPELVRLVDAVASVPAPVGINGALVLAAFLEGAAVGGVVDGLGRIGAVDFVIPYPPVKEQGPPTVEKPKPAQVRLSEAQIDELVRKYTYVRLSTKCIAAHFGISAVEVRAYLRERNIRRPTMAELNAGFNEAAGWAEIRAEQDEDEALLDAIARGEPLVRVEYGPTPDPVDDALAFALTEAARAGQWALVDRLRAARDPRHQEAS